MPSPKRDKLLYDLIEEGRTSTADLCGRFNLKLSTLDRIYREQRALAHRGGKPKQRRRRRFDGAKRNFDFSYFGFLSPHLFTLYRFYLQGHSPGQATRLLKLNGVTFRDAASKMPYQWSKVSATIRRIFYAKGPRQLPGAVLENLNDREAKIKARLDIAQKLRRELQRCLAVAVQKPQDVRRDQEIADAELDEEVLLEIVTPQGLYCYVRAAPHNGRIVRADSPLTIMQDWPRDRAAKHCKRMGYKVKRIYSPETNSEDEL